MPVLLSGVRRALRGHAGAPSSGPCPHPAGLTSGVRRALPGDAGAPSAGRLRPIEFATGAVLGGFTVGLVTVGSVVPFATALQLVAAVPLSVLAHRYRQRAVLLAATAAGVVTFVAAGLVPATGIVASATIAGITGGVKRRGGSIGAVLGLSLLASIGWGAYSVAFLVVFGQSRQLFFQAVRSTSAGVAKLAGQIPQLAPVGRGIVAVTEQVLRYWWVYIGGIAAGGTVVTALVSWYVLGAVLDRLTWLPGTDQLDASADDRPVNPLPVTLRQVSFRYPDAPDDTLSDIDLTLRAGEFVAIVGHNASGKSTLTRLLAGLPPTSGTVERPGSAGLGKLGGTALVLQRPESQTLGVLVADDVVWGLPTELAARVDIDALLREVGLAGFGRRETAALSGGQQQRLAVAAALARRPALLIADEATAMIDPDGRRDLVDLLASLPRRHQMTVVLVTHQHTDTAAADRVVHLSAGRMVDHLPDWPRPRHYPRTRPLGSPLLTLRNLGHVHNHGTPWATPALDGINLTVHRGEALLLVGGNGSGKTTLAWIMAGLTTPTTGSCELQGKPVSQQIPAVALAFQHSRLQLSRHTVGEDIADWGGRASSSRAVGRALDAVGLDRALAVTSIEQLSGGQAKRVVLAGIIARGPQILVLDEPLAGLDPQGRADIVALLAELRDGGLTLVVISHDIADLAGLCDRTVHVHAGRIAEPDWPASPDRTRPAEHSGASAQLPSELLAPQHIQRGGRL